MHPKQTSTLGALCTFVNIPLQEYSCSASCQKCTLPQALTLPIEPIKPSIIHTHTISQCLCPSPSPMPHIKVWRCTFLPHTPHNLQSCCHKRPHQPLLPTCPQGIHTVTPSCIMVHHLDPKAHFTPKSLHTSLDLSQVITM